MRPMFAVGVFSSFQTCRFGKADKICLRRLFRKPVSHLFRRLLSILVQLQVTPCASVSRPFEIVGISANEI